MTQITRPPGLDEKDGGEKKMLTARKLLFLMCSLILAVTFPLRAFAEDQAPDVPGKLMQAAGALLEELAGEDMSEEEPEYGNTFNVLLVGSDRRDSSWNGNSDTMILVSVNYDTRQIHMISFMRDLGADIPGSGIQKLNAAFAIGGTSLLEDTLRSNFGVRIDNHIAVDFYDMIDIIDQLGGVDMEVRDDEIENVNMYIMSMCPYMGLDANNYMLSQGGYLHLNGMQAVAFCRVRFVGDNDYERTERQRRVLTALLNSVHPDSAEDVAALLFSLLTDTDTDISIMDLIQLAPVFLEISDYEIITGRVPFDGMYSSSGEMLIPSQPDTNEKLQQMLY